ncbi:MAG: adenosylmethionine--8-amino-7-oxononanoate transaminase [Gammaproteobacteria bacterium]|nr:adenosylmethionine--8-amino-7-oxononanoate transaminase [Gammaproteobacteria bacterium]
MNQFDQNNLWHPYAKIPNTISSYHVISAEGVYLNLDNGKKVIDGMSSWWSVIHGYNNQRLNEAIKTQLDQMSHVMFGGLTHEPAIKLGQKLIEITPKALNKVFFADSGSISVEVALKMALQYWHQKGEKNKTKFVTPFGGYHGDTFGAMSVCDPDNGMHSMFSGVLTKNFFAKRPNLHNTDEALDDLKAIIQNHHHEIAALILEPIVQGAGGMNFYSSDYLIGANQLCKEFGILLIFDEIATGFGRTGKLFALEHANVVPDILCVGKALTGGYMTLAATITSDEISNTVGTLMHGPTFMANPLACTVAFESINLLLESNWESSIDMIEKELRKGLLPFKENNSVNAVRVLGAIGIVEMKELIDVEKTQSRLIENGVWLRPFGKLLYTMPPFVSSSSDIHKIISAIHSNIL